MKKGMARAERLREMERLYLQHPGGFTDMEMAQRLGVDRTTVYRDRRELESVIPFVEVEPGRWHVDRTRYLSSIRVNLNEALVLYLAALRTSRHTRTSQPYVASALVFLLMGATVTLDMFGELWLAMLIGIGGVLVARALGIFGITPLLSLLPGVERITLGQRICLAWGGLRDAVALALALALSLPVDLEYWRTIQSIAFGVVLFSLLVQAPSMPPLIP